MNPRYNDPLVLASHPIKLLSPCASFRFCQSELHREYDNFAIRIIIKMLARPTEVGARTLVHGASAEPESHGQYVPDCKITPTAGLARGKEGAELQNRVWLELKEKLEAILPGVASLP